jgi:hypothetical protein
LCKSFTTQKTLLIALRKDFSVTRKAAQRSGYLKWLNQMTLKIRKEIQIILITMAFSPLGITAEANALAAIKPGSEIIFETRNGPAVRVISSLTEYSYKFKNRSDQEIEVIYGIIDINSSQNQYLSKSERQKIENFDIAKIGESIRFSFNGNSGSGNWTRAVNVDVNSEEQLTFNDKLYVTKIIEGRISASNTYDLRFKCWYSIELKLCIKSETDIYSQRNPVTNGKNSSALISIK